MSADTDKMKGKSKQVVGKLTNNKKLEAKGNAQEAKGSVKKSVKHAGDKLSNTLDKTSKKLKK